jgi:pimeloyl-ACP methyl ester carboxylesterase
MIVASKYIVCCMALSAFGLYACNENPNSNQRIKTDNMDTMTKNRETAKGISGTAGLIYVDDGGSGNNLPVIFLHSFGGSTQHWAPQLAHLRGKRRAVAYDSRGHGLSDKPADNDYSVHSLAADLAAVVDSLHIPRFILVGHSQGGATSIAYAAAHPDRVAGLLLEGTPGKTPAQQSRSIIASLESDKYERVMEDYMKTLLTNARPSVDTLERSGMKKLSKEACLAIIREMFNYDPLPDLSKYSGPKLIVYSAREAQPNSLFKQVPWVPNRMVQGTSHWIHLDKPEAFNNIMDEFLKSVK